MKKQNILLIGIRYFFPEEILLLFFGIFLLSYHLNINILVFTKSIFSKKKMNLRKIWIFTKTLKNEHFHVSAIKKITYEALNYVLVKTVFLKVALSAILMASYLWDWVEDMDVSKCCRLCKLPQSGFGVWLFQPIWGVCMNDRSHKSWNTSFLIILKIFVVLVMPISLHIHEFCQIS